MSNNQPHEVGYLIDHCRALIYAIIALEPPEAKEILSFVLQQQIGLLHTTHQQEINQPLEMI
nr:hypothetical protein [uncultured Moellerella sp.]